MILRVWKVPDIMPAVGLLFTKGSANRSSTEKLSKQLFGKLPAWSYNTNRIHVKKSIVICTTQLAGGLLLKMLKYFEFMLKEEYTMKFFFQSIS